MNFEATHKDDKEPIGPSFWRAGAFMALDQNHWAVAWGNPRWSQVPDKTKLSFYAPNFFLTKQQPWLLFDHSAILSRKDLWEVVAGSEKLLKKDILQWDHPSEEYFRQQFTLIMEKFDDGELEKAVPVIFSQTKKIVNKILKQDWWRRLLSLEGVHPFGFWTEAEGMIGATPEILFSMNEPGELLHTMALAGTGDAQKDLLSDHKEMVEHNWVADEMTKLLSGFGKVQRSKTYEWLIPPLKHLRTDLDLNLNVDTKEDSLEVWVQRLHPTPALGVAPQRKNWHWLQTLNYSEPMAKLPQRHGAPFAVQTPEGHIKCVVAIRQVQWQDEQLFMGSGCGVVPESQFESEWGELQLKRKAVQGVLGL